MSASRDERSGPSYSSVPLDDEKVLEPGTIVADSRFVVQEEIGSGGVGIVYRADDRRDGGRSVALKVVRARHVGATIEARYRNEARLGANFDGHPSFVRALAVGTLDGPDDFVGRAYLATEYVEGTALDELISSHAAGIPPARAIAIALDVARGLAHLHARGIVHRDVKPSNVLLVAGARPETEHAKVIDFGLAYCTGDNWEARSPDLTQDGKAPGTLLYMAPEQLAHARPTPAFDVYAFGVMVYEMLSGGAPNEGLPVGELYARKCDPNGRIYPLTKMCAELPVELTSIVDRCLSYDPEERPSVVELVELLERLGREMGSSAPVIPLRPVSGGAAGDIRDAEGGDELRASPAIRPRRTRRVVATILGFGCVVGVWAWAWSWFGAPQSEPATSDAIPLAEHAENPSQGPEDAKPRQVPDATKEAEHADDIGPRAVESGHDDAEADPIPDGGSEPAPEPLPSGPPIPSRNKPDTSAKATDPTSDPPTSPPKQPDEHVPAQPTCEQHRTQASSAQEKKKWATVLTATRDRDCWSGDKTELARLRVEALMNLERYTACAKEAFRSSDAQVLAWGKTCFRRAKESEKK